MAFDERHRLASERVGEVAGLGGRLAAAHHRIEGVLLGFSGPLTLEASAIWWMPGSLTVGKQSLAPCRNPKHSSKPRTTGFCAGAGPRCHLPMIPLAYPRGSK